MKAKEALCLPSVIENPNSSLQMINQSVLAALRAMRNHNPLTKAFEISQKFLVKFAISSVASLRDCFVLPNYYTSGAEL